MRAATAPQVKVFFAACPVASFDALLAETRAIMPELPTVVVSEFPPLDAEWIAWNPRRAFRDNLALVRARLNGRRVRISAAPLLPNLPPEHRHLRMAAFLLSPRYFLAFTEDEGGFAHWMLRPRGLPWILRRYLLRGYHLTKHHLGPTGGIGKRVRAVKHKRVWRSATLKSLARASGALCVMLKTVAPQAAAPEIGPPLPDGISVVIPSRNGRDLLASLLPEVAAQLRGAPSEIIVVDNGSDDGTAAWLGREYPDAIADATSQPLSFADAVNRGAARARFSRLMLLNNDMRVQPGFFDALMRAFDKVPDLFCATAQIFMPDGRRREETGKAVYSPNTSALVPLRCDEPTPGENLTYVFYGSGGCSMYDAARWRAVGGMNRSFRPAYVEDLDLGFRAWRLAWPSVFVEGAKVVHNHRSTTSKYFEPAALDRFVQANYLRFLAHSVSTPALFRSMWNEAIARTDETALRDAWFAPAFMEPLPRPAWPEEQILALGNGEVAVFEGAARRGKPAVLIASAYLPFPLSHGGAVRIFNLARRAAADFDQVLVAFVDDLRQPAPELLDIFCEVVCVRRQGTHLIADNGRPDMVEDHDRPACHAAIAQTVRKWKPAVAQLEFTHMAQYWRDCAPARTILVEHDITFDLNRQLLEHGEDWELRRQYERWVEYEKRAWTLMDRVVAMSEKDRATIDRPNAVVLPNGVDVQRFRPSRQQPDDARILFIGAFRHLPNLLALEWFMGKVWPALAPLRPTLHVIAGERPEFYRNHYGHAALDLNAPGIEVDGFVADVRPAYERATVVIAPLLASAGTNIKVMEAMAMGKAVVSTRAGINGLDRLHPGRDVVVTDEAEDMAAAIALLIAEPRTRAEIERQARDTAERYYDWDVIALQQRALYESLIG